MIKIRGWNKQSKKMTGPSTLNSLLLSELNNGVAQGRSGLKQVPCDDADKYWSDMIWMLWSGRVDKNGVEIYDGDKVKVYFFLDTYVIYEVLYDGGQWCLTGNDKHDDDYLWNFDENDEMEVIGHIYSRV